jgi:pSer/pThr/pTyr-binding forkhead associated (FHA) protein
VALDETADILLDRAMVVVGRHPGCDARIDSLRISRHHCCVARDGDSISVRDLGSTNGVWINDRRIEAGELRAGDELKIAHIRYKLDDGVAIPGPTLAADGSRDVGAANRSGDPPEHALAAAVRGLLPGDLVDRCRIRVIVHVADERDRAHSGVGDPIGTAGDVES